MSFAVTFSKISCVDEADLSHWDEDAKASSIQAVLDGEEHMVGLKVEVATGPYANEAKRVIQAIRKTLS